MSAAVKSIEDHGYILDFGIPGIFGFLSFADATKGSFDTKAILYIGQLLDVIVTKVSGNGRTFTVSVDPESFVSSSVRLLAPFTYLLFNDLS